MGGGAFQTGLFPRLSPALYKALKARHTAAIQSLYTLAVTPVEAPEKADHGDLDFIVWRDGLLPSHDSVADVLGATMVNAMEGARTSNYAVPLEQEGPACFYQVDVHLCADEDELKRTVFFHSYGDMGMIMGLVARGVGLHMGVHGLKYPHPPFKPWLLTSDFSRVLDFFGWSKERFERGFQTKQDLFAWLASTPMIRQEMFTRENAVDRVKKDRSMYYEFVQWARDQDQWPGPKAEVNWSAQKEAFRDRALHHFGLKEEVEVFLRTESARAKYKTAFNGKLVSQWAGLGEDWRSVKIVMDEVRRECGGDEALSRIVWQSDDGGAAILEQKVLDAKHRCGISSG